MALKITSIECVSSTSAHEASYQDICDLIGGAGMGTTSLDLLALASNLVGRLIAMQDSSVVSKTEAMKIVALNMEAGNRQMVEDMQGWSRPN